MFENVIEDPEDPRKSPQDSRTLWENAQKSAGPQDPEDSILEHRKVRDRGLEDFDEDRRTFNANLRQYVKFVVF